MALQTTLDAMGLTAFKDSVNHPAAQHLSQSLQSALSRYRYELTPTAVQMLRRTGIHTSFNGTIAHPHPIHKTIETHLLYEHWSFNLPRDSEATVMFMKPEKFAQLQKQNPAFTTLLNYIVVPKDQIRYKLDSNHLPDTPHLFIHDALMYLSPGEIATLFDSSSRLKCIHASLVLPPESLFGLQSLNPEMYDYSIEDDDMVYRLEGNPTDSYRQPMSARVWLETACFSWGEQCFSVEILASWGSVHSLLITRQESKPETRYFKTPAIKLLSPPDALHLPLQDRLVPATVIDHLYSYTHGVRTLRVSDTTAHVLKHQFKADHAWVTAVAWEQLAKFGVDCSKASPNSVYRPTPAWMDRFFGALQRTFWRNVPKFSLTVACCSSAALTLRWFGRRWSSLIVLSPIALHVYHIYNRHVYRQNTFEAHNAYFHPPVWQLAVKRGKQRITPRPFLNRPWLTVPSNTEEPLTECVTTEPVPAAPTPVVSKVVEPETALPPVEEQSTPPVKNTSQDHRLMELLHDNSAIGNVLAFNELYPELSENEPHLAFSTRRRDVMSAAPALPLNNICLLRAVSSAAEIPIPDLFRTLVRYLPDSQIVGSEQREHGYATDHLAVLAWCHDLSVRVHAETCEFTVGPAQGTQVDIYHTPGHWSDTPSAAPERLVGSGLSPAATTVMNYRDPNGNLLPFLQVHDYQRNNARARNLASNMKERFEGVLATANEQRMLPAPDYWETLDKITAFNTSGRTVNLVHLAGFAGCGKSYPVKQMLLKSYKQLRDYMVVTPTTVLRSEWKEDLKLKKHESWRVSTWEMALTKQCTFLVIDEVYKLPNGYLDLMLYVNPSITMVILLGDPCQGVYHSLNPSSTNHLLKPEVQHLRPYLDAYCLWTHRVPQSVAALLQVKSFNPNHGRIIKSPELTPGRVNLVSSHALASQLNDKGHYAITMSASQGLTFDKLVQIHVDRNASSISPAVSLVAVTRSKTGVVFSGSVQDLAGTNSANTLLFNIANGKRCSFVHMFHRELSDARILYEPFKVRPARVVGGTIHLSANEKAPRQITSDIVSSSDTLIDAGELLLPDPDVSFLPGSRLLLHSAIPPTLCEPTTANEPKMPEPVLEAVYTGVDYQTLASTLSAEFIPESKEKPYNGLLSYQFPYLDEPYIYGTAPPSLVAPVHNQKKDPSLLPLSISKRLRFRVGDGEYRVTERDVRVASVLFESYCKTLNRAVTERVPFDAELFMNCITLNDISQLSKKSQATLIANHERSDPTLAHTFVRIFTKTQHKINSNNIFGDWKACQTLALMHDWNVLTFGPIKKYQRMINDPARRPNIFVYGGKTPLQLAEFVRSRFSNRPSVENDYTAFDQSQLGEALMLEVYKMRQVCIPEAFIQAHIHLKTNLQSQLGPLTCMRFTGEPGTYDDNTDYNLSVLFTLFEIGDQHTVLVSGDDSVVHPLPDLSPRWDSIANDMVLQFKISLTQYPLFCSYYLGPEGAIRAPTPLFHKVIISEAQKTLDKTMASYISEFALGHSLGQSLWNLLPESEHIYQEALFDFFCRKASRQLKVLLKLGEHPSGVPYSELRQKNRLAALRAGAGEEERVRWLSELEGVLKLNLN